MTVTDATLKPEKLPFLRSLSAATRNSLLESALQHSVRVNTILFEQGEVPNFQLAVMSGSAQLLGRSEGREVLIEVVRAPDLIIPAAVVSDAPYLMQARVPEPSRLLLIPASAFRLALAADLLLANAVIGTLAQQFRRMVTLSLSAYSTNDRSSPQSRPRLRDGRRVLMPKPDLDAAAPVLTWLLRAALKPTPLIPRWRRCGMPALSGA